MLQRRGGEVLEVAGQQPVRRDDEVGGVVVDGALEPLLAVVAATGPLGAVVDDDAQVRREAPGLGLPVVHDRQRADDEVRAGPVEEVGERGRRLAEPHVVGQAPAEPEAGEEAHPRQAAALVRAQRAVEAGWLELLA